jgi:hypothetical protein
MASVPPMKPTKCLLFRSPLPKGEGIKQALAWNREQLLDLRHLWELRRQRRLDQGLIPMTRPPTTISDDALAVGNSENTATGTPRSFLTHHSTSLQTPLESQCQDPFRPTAWRDLTSVVRRPRRWQLASSTVSTQNDQDIPEVPPSYDYGEEFARVVAEGLGITPEVAAEGLGIRNRRGRRGGQGRGNRPQPVPDARRPANAQPTQERLPARRPSSPTLAGFEHNRGPAFIPFRIRNEHRGETPARYICAHLDAPNPYVEGCLSLNGPTYHSEIHAATIHDLDVPPPMITADLLQLLDTDYMGHERVDEALGEIGDRSLQAEVNRYRRLSRKRKSFEESIRRLEDQMFTNDVERRMCTSRLESARALVRIQHKMQDNRHAFRLSPWSLERGRLP